MCAKLKINSLRSNNQTMRLRLYSDQKSPLVHLFGPDQKRTLFFSFGAVRIQIVLFASGLYSVNTSTCVTIGALIGQH